MEIELIAEVLTIVLVILNAYLGRKYTKAKRLLKEITEALDETYKALEDNKITQEELKQVIKQWKDLLEVWRELV